MEHMPSLKVGQWVVIGKGALWGNDINAEGYLYKTKTLAIDDIASACMDTEYPRRVKRIASGEYTYQPRNIIDGKLGQEFVIKKVTANNIAELNELLKEQLEYVMLSEYYGS